MQYLQHQELLLRQQHQLLPPLPPLPQQHHRPLPRVPETITVRLVSASVGKGDLGLENLFPNL
jgi:hypothetical protein